MLSVRSADWVHACLRLLRICGVLVMEITVNLQLKVRLLVVPEKGYDKEETLEHVFQYAEENPVKFLSEHNNTMRKRYKIWGVEAEPIEDFEEILPDEIPDCDYIGA